MKTRINFKTSLALTFGLILSSIMPAVLSATPLQSDTKSAISSAPPQAAPSIYDPQPVYDSQPAYDSQQVYTHPSESGCGCGQAAPCSSCAPAPVASSGCGCSETGGRTCGLRKGGCKLGGCKICKRSSCRSSKCPSCSGDICKLEVEKTKKSKTYFKTEQKAVCVPAVRLPWKKGCPPKVSKTRLVNKLSTGKYECPHCSYKWSLVEPEEPAEAKEPTAAQPLEVYEPTPVYDSYLPPEAGNITPTESITPGFETPGTYTPPQVVPDLGSPAVPTIQGVIPPPPATGSLPWRAGSPSS